MCCGGSGGGGTDRWRAKTTALKHKRELCRSRSSSPPSAGGGGGGGPPGGKAKTPVFTVASNREGDEDREQYTWQQTGGKLVTQTLLSSTRLLSVRRERV